MKTHFLTIVLILVAVLSFIIGYSMAPTDVSVVRHGEAMKAVDGNAPSSSPASGGYGGGAAAPAAGGYGGAAPAPAAGGYGGAAPAPAAGGYGSH